MGILTFFMIFLLSFGSRAFLVGSRLWLAEWSSTSNISYSKRDFYLGVYASLGCGQAITLVINLYVSVLGYIAASRLLHDKLLSTILRCPMSFFETTPMGRIVNRFSNDINVIDQALPRCMDSWFKSCMSSLASLIVISYSTPIFLTVCVPIALLYLATQVINLLLIY